MAEHYYRCSADCPQQTINFTEPLNISNHCEEYQEAEPFRLALICVIDYRIDYDAEHIYLQFRATNDTSIFEGENNTEYLSQSLWLGLSFESNQPNITHRQYSCRTEDDCARKFYLTTIQRLIRQGNEQFEKIRRKLYNQTSPRSHRRCIDSRRKGNRTAVRCDYGLCYAQRTHHRFMDHEKFSREQQCRRETAATFFNERQYYLPDLMHYERESIEYTCNKHLCNRKETIEAVRTILNDYTRWNVSDDDKSPRLIQMKSSFHLRTSSFKFVFLTLSVLFRSYFS